MCSTQVLGRQSRDSKVKKLNETKEETVRERKFINFLRMKRFFFYRQQKSKENNNELP